MMKKRRCLIGAMKGPAPFGMCKVEVTTQRAGYRLARAQCSFLEGVLHANVNVLRPMSKRGKRSACRGGKQEEEMKEGGPAAGRRAQESLKEPRGEGARMG